MLNTKVQTARIEATGRGDESGFFLYLIERDITRLEYDLRWRDIYHTMDAYKGRGADLAHTYLRIPAFTVDPDKASGFSAYKYPKVGRLEDQVVDLPATSGGHDGKGEVRVIRPEESVFVPNFFGRGYPTRDGIEVYPGIPMGFYRRKIDAMVAWEDFLRTLIPPTFMPLLNMGITSEKRPRMEWEGGIIPRLEIVEGLAKLPYETLGQFKRRVKLHRYD